MPKKPIATNPENPARAEVELNFRLGTPVEALATGYSVPLDTVKSWVEGLQVQGQPLTLVPKAPEVTPDQVLVEVGGNGNGATSPMSTGALKKFAVRQDYDAMMPTDTPLKSVPIRKPSKQAWIRVRPGTEWKLVVYLLRLEDRQNEAYVVSPDLRSELVDEIDPVVMHLAIDRGGNPFFWPIKQTDKTGKPNSWLISSSEAALQAESEWIRLTADQGVGRYRWRVAPPGIPNPVWPKHSLDELFDIAIRNNSIDSMTHPVVRQLEGSYMTSLVREVWVFDFEYYAPDGERPTPVCLVAHELLHGSRVRLWHEEFGPKPPFEVGEESLFIGFYTPGDVGCFKILGWELPSRVLDLFTEARCIRNGMAKGLLGNGLLDVCTFFGVDAMHSSVKEMWRKLVMAGGPWSSEQREGILDYCESDVILTARLYRRMSALPQFNWPHALIRGQFTKAVAMMEHVGVPIDVPSQTILQDRWDEVRTRVIESIDQDYRVFEGTTFKKHLFEAYLRRHSIPWPKTDGGQPSMEADTFHKQAMCFPILRPLQQLWSSLGKLRAQDFTVGKDGHNRTLLSMFGTKTGRNTPSNAKAIFGAPSWLRSLIKPAPGRGVAYLDWSRQEWGIAAVLSGDAEMIRAYESGDPYLAFAIAAGAAPPGATKATHGEVRDRFKTCVLALQYGQGAEGLAIRLNQSVAHARELLRHHHEVYRRYWKWSEGVEDYGLLSGELHTRYRWDLNVYGSPVNTRSLANFPIQANGSEMLRIACCRGVELGVQICAPVHDAVLIEAPLETLDESIALMQRVMKEASAAVLDGFELGTDATVFTYPERYRDPRGKMMWDRVWSLLGIDPDKEGKEVP